MRFFQHITSEYTCTKHCGHHRSITGASALAPFYLIVATTTAIALWLLSRFTPWHLPWYSLFTTFLPGELLLLFASGFLSSFLLSPFTHRGINICPNCRAPTFFAGRHFDPKGSPKPNRADIVILILFTALNIAAVLALITRK